MLGETTVTVCLTWYDIKYPESRLQGEIIFCVGLDFSYLESEGFCGSRSRQVTLLKTKLWEKTTLFNFNAVWAVAQKFTFLAGVSKL